MKKNNRGFTLVEMMFLVATIGLVLAIVGAGVSTCGMISSPTVEARANEDARAYIMGLYPNATELHTVCPPTDSDGDQYVTCTATFNDRGQEHLESIDCRASWLFDYARACRTTRIPMVRQLRQ